MLRLLRRESIPWAVAILVQATTAAVWHVAPTGSDTDPGTLEKPFASLQKGHAVAIAGDTVYLHGGVYQVTTPASDLGGVAISTSGKPGKPIRYLAYGAEQPVFDFSKLAISTTGYTHGFYVTGSHLVFRGIEIRNVPMNTRSNTGMTVRNAAFDTFERMDFHHNNGAGFFINGGTGGHLVLNSDAHDNYDPTSTQGDGQNADGFGVHYQETGDTTRFRGCRAWWNSDDGWDLISQEFPVVIENSWAYGSGYINSGASHPADGNGNGFKAGSSKNGVRHTIRNCVAWKNYAAGFYANHSAGGNDWINNMAWQNGTAFNLLASSWDAAGNRTDGVLLTGNKVHLLRNNIGFPNKNANMTGADSKNNTWDLGIVPASTDFTSVDDAGFKGARKADGSLPDIAFLKPKAGSAMIDKGTEVGLAFTGKAPDLGAYEFGAVSSREPAPKAFRGTVPSQARMLDLVGRKAGSGTVGIRLARWIDADGMSHQALVMAPR